jgi:hypothetical protein
MQIITLCTYLLALTLLQSTQTKTPNRILQETPKTIFLSAKDESHDYASCAGTYDLEPDMEMNGKLVYHSPGQSRWIVFNGITWTITADIYVKDLYDTKAKNFGGFHFSSGFVGSSRDPLGSDWEWYTVKAQDAGVSAAGHPAHTLEAITVTAVEKQTPDDCSKIF